MSTVAEKRTWKLWLIGGGLGLAFGLAYWFAWGCRACAADNSPLAIVGFCVLAGAVLTRRWGVDHLRGS